MMQEMKLQTYNCATSTSFKCVSAPSLQGTTNSPGRSGLELTEPLAIKELSSWPEGIAKQNKKNV